MSYTKRHMRRLVKKKREEYFFSDSENPHDAVEERNDAVDEHHDAIFDIVENVLNSENDNNRVKELTFREKIRNWQLDARISSKNMRSLLKILHESGLDVPLSPSVLMEVKNQIILTEDVPPGDLVYFGIENQLKNISGISSLIQITVDINIDGLPLFKSSQKQLWPILVKVVNCNNSVVFPVAIYEGKTKPGDICVYLESFVAELENLLNNGVAIDGKFIPLSVRAVICDAPAKSFVCGIAHHSSAHGCSKCTQIAKKIKNKLAYSTQIGSSITNTDFATRKYKEHHQDKFISSKSPLEKLNLNMISQVPLDPMHLIDLGVTKKMLVALLKNKFKFRMSKSSQEQISSQFELVKKYIPKEFVRLPRNFKDIHNWKATEFRQFLLYTGILLLKGHVHEDFYYIFLLLHCACRLLSSPSNYLGNLSTAEDLLKLFVENFAVIFGPESVSYNVHGLLHICDCVRELGSLYTFSAYDFENHLQLIKRNVRKPTQILKQLANINQISQFSFKESKIEIKEDSNSIKSYKLKNLYLSSKRPNNACVILPDIRISIKNIKKSNEGKIILEAVRFKNIRPFFTSPLNSLALGIGCSDSLSEEIEEFKAEDVAYKLMLLPSLQNFLLLPLLSSCTF